MIQQENTTMEVGMKVGKGKQRKIIYTPLHLFKRIENS